MLFAFPYSAGVCAVEIVTFCKHASAMLCLCSKMSGINSFDSQGSKKTKSSKVCGRESKAEFSFSFMFSSYDVFLIPYLTLVYDDIFLEGENSNQLYRYKK